MKNFKLRPTGRRHVVPLWGQMPMNYIDENEYIPDYAIKTKNMIEYELRVYLPETPMVPIVSIPEQEYGERFVCAANVQVPDNLIVCACMCKGKDEFCDFCGGIGYVIEDRNEVLNNRLGYNDLSVKLYEPPKKDE